MKRIRFALTALVTLIILGGCSSSPTTETKKGEPVKAALISDADPEIKLAQRVAYDSGDFEAEKVASNLYLTASIAQVERTDGRTFKVLLRQKKAQLGQLLPVIIVGPDDHNISSQLGDWYDGELEGEYRASGEMKAIFIRGRDRNEFDYGCLLLHEAGHAMLCADGKQPKTPQEVAEQEVRLYKMDHRIRSAIGGEPYRLIVDREKKALSAPGTVIKKDKDGLFTVHVQTPGSYRQELENIFGSCGSDQDALKRNDAVWRQALFELIDEQFSSAVDADACKELCYWKFEREKDFQVPN